MKDDLHEFISTQLTKRLWRPLENIDDITGWDSSEKESKKS